MEISAPLPLHMVAEQLANIWIIMDILSMMVKVFVDSICLQFIIGYFGYIVLFGSTMYVYLIDGLCSDRMGSRHGPLSLCCP